MSQAIAIDTSVLVGLLNPRDVWRQRAQALHDAILQADLIPTYFDCAVSEAIGTAVRRLQEKHLNHDIVPLFDFLHTLLPQRKLTWIFPDVTRLYPHVLDLMRASSGELNFNDALIALACREREIPAIASFDADFDQVAWLKRMAEPDDLRDAR